MIALDIETTGLVPGIHDMCSIGAVHLETREPFYVECRIRKEALISEKALEVNGETRESLTDGSKRKPIEALVSLFLWTERFVPEEERMLMGWNLPSFDVQFLKWYYRNYDGQLPNWLFSHRYVDLHSWAYLLLDKSIRSVDACEEFGVEKEPEPHNALEGARQNVRLYYEMREEIYEMKEEIHNLKP